MHLRTTALLVTIVFLSACAATGKQKEVVNTAPVATSPQVMSIDPNEPFSVAMIEAIRSDEYLKAHVDYKHSTQHRIPMYIQKQIGYGSPVISGHLRVLAEGWCVANGGETITEADLSVRNGSNIINLRSGSGDDVLYCVKNGYTLAAAYVAWDEYLFLDPKDLSKVQALRDAKQRELERKAARERERNARTLALQQTPRLGDRVSIQVCLERKFQSDDCEIKMSANGSIMDLRLPMVLVRTDFDRVEHWVHKAALSAP